MRYLRSLPAALLLIAVMLTLATATSCGTSAVGVDDCRDIEQARCRAAEACGIIDDVAGCERFYRDHCLHGLPVEPPAGASVAACVEVIDAAGRCARANAQGRLTDCDEPVATPKRGFTTACDVVTHPERAPECSFLVAEPDAAAGGAGGQSSQADASDPNAAGNGGAGQTAQAGAAVE